MTARVPGPYWRVKWAGIGAIAALVLVALAWLLTTVVKSPQEALASAAPPPPSRITVPVEHKVLDLGVSVTGQMKGSREVTGKLNVDDRDKASHDRRITVVSGDKSVSGTLGDVAADGEFTLKLSKALEAQPDAPVQVKFEAAEQTAGLVVPLSALFTMADGDTGVVVYKNHLEHQIEVTMGASAAGFVQVTPVHPGSLLAKDHVLVSEPEQ